MIYTLITKTQAQDILDKFGISKPIAKIEIEPLANGGFANSNYRISVENGESEVYLLRVCNEKTLSDIVNQITVMRMLEQHNITTNVPHCVKGCDDVYYIMHDFEGNGNKMPVLLLSYIEGDVPVHFSRDQIRILGRNMAEIHQIKVHTEMKMNMSMSDFFLTPEAGRKLLVSSEKHMAFHDEIVSWIDSSWIDNVWRSVTITETENDSLCYGLLHGDVFPSNTVITTPTTPDGAGSNQIVLIDWEEASFGPTVLDVAMAIVGCCFIGDEIELNKDLYDDYLLAYEEINPLSEHEKGILSDCIRLCLISVGAWRYVHLADSNGDGTWKVMTDRLKRLSWVLEMDKSSRSILMNSALRHCEKYMLDPSADYGHDTLECVINTLHSPIYPEHPAIDLKSIENVLNTLTGPATSHSIPSVDPGFFGYVPGGGIFSSVVGEFIGAFLNKYTGCYFATPGLVTLECDVLRWFCEMVGYAGEEAGGIFTTGGSLAAFHAFLAARTARFGIGGITADFLNACVYITSETHHSIHKAIALSGVSSAHVRYVDVIECDGDSGGDHGTCRILSMDPTSLQRHIEADKKNGLVPWIVVATAGTTNTGAIDDLAAISQVVHSEGEGKVWMHVDGAMGGFFLMTDRGKVALNGMECADSIVLDPHKGMFLPYGVGCLLVKDRMKLRRAFGHLQVPNGAYMPQSSFEEPNNLAWEFNEMGIELTRESRGLRVWLPIQLHGFSTFKNALDEKLDLAAWAARELPLRISGCHIVHEPSLSTVAFHFDFENENERGLDQNARNEANKRVLELVNERKRVNISGTVLPSGIYVLRLCIMCYRSHKVHVEMAIEDIAECVMEVRG